MILNQHVALLDEGPSSQSAPPAVIKSCHDADGDPQDHNMPSFSPIDLVGCTFLLEPCEDGQQLCAWIVKAIEDHKDKLAHHPEHLKCLCSVNDDAAEEIMSYNDILVHIQWDEDSNIVWKFWHITSHEGPIKPSHPGYKGSSNKNTLVEWENREIMSKPLNIIAADDTDTCA